MSGPRHILESLFIEKNTSIKRHHISYRNLTQLLEFLWKSLLIGIEREWKEYEDINQVYENLIEPTMLSFFSPRITKKSKTRILETYPTFVNTKLKTFQADISLAKRMHMIESITNGIDELPIITPEGMVLCYILKKYSLHDEISPSLASIAEIELLSQKLYNGYRTFVIDKIQQLNIADEKLSSQEMGLILFFIYNGNVGKQNALHVNSEEIRLVIAKCVSSFNLQEEIADVSLTLLDRILPHIQRKLGFLLHNERRQYYITSDKIDILFHKLIQKRTESPWSKDLVLRWRNFRNEYEKQTPILRALDSYHFSPKYGIQIESKIILGNLDD